MASWEDTNSEVRDVSHRRMQRSIHRRQGVMLALLAGIYALLLFLVLAPAARTVALLLDLR